MKPAKLWIPPTQELRMKQIIVAPWESETGMTYSTIGLSEDGKVYCYDSKCNGWYPWSMTTAECPVGSHKR